MLAIAPPLTQTTNLSRPAVMVKPARMDLVQVPASVLQVFVVTAAIIKTPLQFVTPKPKMNTAVLGVQPAVQMSGKEQKLEINIVQDTALLVPVFGAAGQVYPAGQRLIIVQLKKLVFMVIQFVSQNQAAVVPHISFITPKNAMTAIFTGTIL